MTATPRIIAAIAVSFGVSGLAQAASKPAPTLPNAPVPYSALKDIDAQMNGGPAKGSKSGKDGKGAKHGKGHAKAGSRSADLPDCPGDPICPHN